MWDQVGGAAAKLSGGTPVPSAAMLAAATLLGLLLALWAPGWRAAHKAITIAHEGGHAFAAVFTRRRVLRVHVNPDGSGSTQTLGTPGGFGAAMVSFAGYPFPALVGAGLITASVSGSARLWAAITAFALLVLLWRTRNLHGWLIVGLVVLGIAAAAWYAPGEVLAVGLAALGAFLVAGSARSLLSERRARRTCSADSDVAALARRGRLPAGFWWTAMMAVVLGSGWLAWQQVAATYPGLW